MPNQTTVSMRKYNKELKHSANLRSELEAIQESLSLAKKKNRDLRQQLKLAVDESQELATCQECLKLEKAKNTQLAKRLKLLCDQAEELISSRNSLQIEKEKNLELKQKLKKVSAPGQRELSAARNQGRAECQATLDEAVKAHETELKKTVDTYEARIAKLNEHAKELMTIQETQKRQIEHLELDLHGDAQIPGNLERLDKDPRVSKHPHVISGGRAGSV